MEQTTLEPVDVCITSDKLKGRVARASDNYEFSWDEWQNMDLVAGNPFGKTDEQFKSGNWDMDNSAVWPDVDIDGKPLPSGRHKIGQQFNDVDSKTEVIKTCAHIVDGILFEYPEVASVITQASFVVAKVSEAFGFRIGIVENAAENALENQLDVEVADKTMSEVAKDESNGIDIETTSGELYNVKFENDNDTKKGIKRIDVKQNNNQFLIEVEK